MADWLVEQLEEGKRLARAYFGYNNQKTEARLSLAYESGNDKWLLSVGPWLSALRFVDVEPNASAVAVEIERLFCGVER